MTGKSTGNLIAGLIALLLLAAFIMPTAHAQDDADLLPVEKAFVLKASIAESGRVVLHWDITPDYYLYRSRIKAKSDDATLAPVMLPDGERKTDPFVGDVEVYHHSVDASVDYTLNDATATSLALSVTVQGCHEVDPKICYPPHATRVVLDLPDISAPIAASGDGATMDLSSSNAPAFSFGSKSGGALGGSAFGNAADAGPLPPDQAFVFEAIAASPTSLLARWTMPDNYYLYRDKSSVRLLDASGVELGRMQWPRGKSHHDEHFGTVEVYYHEVELPVALVREDGAAQTIKVEAEYQGCQENGICYPVMTHVVDVSLPQASAAQLAASQANAQPADAGTTETGSGANDADATQTAGAQSEDQVLAASLSSNRLLALLTFFGFGLLLAFTPCVFPMIPILSGIIAGAGENISTRRAFVLSLVYVLATCVVFTIAGVVAGLAGANLQAAFQKPWILWCFAIIFVLLSLSMFGFYELQLPTALQNRIANVSNRQKGGSLVGVAIMGLLSALIVGPCVAPPLAAAVLYISQTRDPVFGGLALFVLSLGMGAPLVVFGTAAGNLMPRAGAWMDAVKAVFGVTFLALAIWMLSRILDPFWIMLMGGALLVACGVYLGALDRLPESVSGWRRLWKSLGVMLLIVGALELVGAFAGGRSVLQPLAGFGVGGQGGAQSASEELPFRTIKSVADLDRELAAAKNAGEPVLLDFYADWCVSCKEMEAFTFTDSRVRDALARFVLLRADVTANDDTDQALLKHFAMFGPPAIILYGTDGVERRAARLIGFEKAAAFTARLDSVEG